MKRPKTFRYTIFLLKESMREFDDALDAEEPTDQYPLKAASNLDGCLYLGKQTTDTPAWVKLLNPYLKNTISRAKIASISAVLLIRYERRIFAITFGHGRSLLKRSSWERDFGLKVTLNRVDPEQLRSIDSKYHDEMVISERTQTSRGSHLGSFGLDIARNLVRGIAGVPINNSHFKNLVGSDSLVITTLLPFADIGDLLDELLTAYNENKYKKHFGWIDFVKEVRDPDIRIRLDEHLVTAIKTAAITNMHLAPADPDNVSEPKDYKYSGTPRRRMYPELELKDYIDDHREDLDKLSVEQLKHHSVKGRHSDGGKFIALWSVYECIVWEKDMDGHTFVFFDGRWFQVTREYAKLVFEHLDSLSSKHKHVEDALIGEREDDYNERMAKANAPQMICMDKKLFTPASARTSIEFCDLFHVSRRVIHVKKRSTSATLSHLFSQASVSCDAFLHDVKFREEIRGHLIQNGNRSHAALIPKDKPSASEFEIIFVVISNTSNRLPFFSAVNIKHHTERMQSLGFQVYLQHVRFA